MSFSVIIPSRKASNLVPCVEAVRRAEPTAEILVIDDGIDWSAAWHLKPIVKVIEGVKPFVFARNMNLGIQACAGDVILLNDDALLETPFGFHELEEASLAHLEYGVISAVTNVVGNLAQQPRDMGLREEPRSLAFVCVYIPRATIDRIGLLDERFTSYGWDDNDYCRRAREAGLKLAIFDDCFVDHDSLHSTFRGLPRAAGDIAPGREIYRAKWGDTA
jgi:GT2 family glycosyltransferase